MDDLGGIATWLANRGYFLASSSNPLRTLTFMATIHLDNSQTIPAGTPSWLYKQQMRGLGQLNWVSFLLSRDSMSSWLILAASPSLAYPLKGWSKWTSTGNPSFWASPQTVSHCPLLPPHVSGSAILWTWDPWGNERLRNLLERSSTSKEGATSAKVDLLWANGKVQLCGPAGSFAVVSKMREPCKILAQPRFTQKQNTFKFCSILSQPPKYEIILKETPKRVGVPLEQFSKGTNVAPSVLGLLALLDHSADHKLPHVVLAGTKSLELNSGLKASKLSSSLQKLV